MEQRRKTGLVVAVGDVLVRLVFHLEDNKKDLISVLDKVRE